MYMYNTTMYMYMEALLKYTLHIYIHTYMKKDYSVLLIQLDGNIHVAFDVSTRWGTSVTSEIIISIHISIPSMVPATSTCTYVASGRNVGS